MSFFYALYVSTFLKNAFIAAIFASILSGLVGPYIYFKKQNSIVGTISHTVLGGVGFMVWFQSVIKKYDFGLYIAQNYQWILDPLIGAFLVGVISSLFISYISIYKKNHLEVVINALWPFGMSLGIFFYYITPGYNMDIQNYLFGSILLISIYDIYIMAILSVALYLLVYVYYQQIKVTLIDDEYSKVLGLKSDLINTISLAITSVVVVLLIRITGITLVLALVTLPVLTASLFSNSIFRIILFTTLFNFIYISLGIYGSYALNVPTSIIITTTSVIHYIFSLKFFKK